MKNFNPHIIIILLSCALISCSTGKRGFMNFKKGSIIYSVMPIIKHDTVIKPPLPRKQLTSAQMQDYLRPFYQANFDQLFAPEFQRLRAIIESQAKANNSQAKTVINLTQILLSMRSRSIKRSDSLTTIINAYQQEILKLKRTELLRDQNQIENNKKQIASTDKLVKYLMIAMLIIVFLVVSGYVLGYFLYRSVKKKLKEINYV